MAPKPHGVSLGDPSKISGSRIDGLNSGEADAREHQPHYRGDTPEHRLWGSGPEPAPAEPADLDKHDPRERGILVSLHDTILENFPVFLRRLVKDVREPMTTASPRDGSTEVRTKPAGFSISDATIASQFASLQRAFIRFNVWGREFDVASGALDKKLEYSEELREDVVLVLLQLGDALHQGLPLLTTDERHNDAINQTGQWSIGRTLELAHFYVGEDSYLGINDTSVATIVDEVSTAIEGLGDLSFCLEAPMECPAINETPRPPQEIGTADLQRVYEEMIGHRFPKADLIAICQHATANCYRLVALQDIREPADNAESDEEGLSHFPHHPADLDTHTIPRTIFHDSGIGTSQRHESSYAQSLMSFARRNDEQYAKLLPKLPEEGASGGWFECIVCLRMVRFANEGLWNAHLLEDLLPYVCIVHNCQKSTEPFETRTLWLEHLKAKHETDLARPDLTCNLCAEVVTGDQKARVAHVENHLIEIALSVLPTGGDHSAEDVAESDGIQTHSQVSGSLSGQILQWVPGEIGFKSEKDASLQAKVGNWLHDPKHILSAGIDLEPLLERGSKESPAASSDEDQKSNKCSFCSKRFATKRNMDRHLKFHCSQLFLNSTRILCKFCGLEFVRSDAFAKHMKHIHKRRPDGELIENETTGTV